jgi:hypothetical protein
LLFGGGLLDVGNDGGLDVVVFVLGVEDLDEIGHDLLLVAVADLGALHDLDLEAEDTLAEFDVTDGNINEVNLGLTSGDLVTSGVLHGLGALSTDLSGDHNFATSGTTTAHDGTNDVVGSVTDGESTEELVLEGLNVGGGGEVLVVGEGLDGELDLVVLVVEVVALLDEGLDFLDLTGGLVEEVLGVGGTDADLSGHVGGTHFDAAVTFHTEGLHEELVELSLENTISNELLLGGDLLNLAVSHLVEFIIIIIPFNTPTCYLVHLLSAKF